MMMNLKKLVEKYNLDIRGIYHIGANTGQELKVYRELGIDVVNMFEPNARCVAVVNAKIIEEKYPSTYVIHQCALGEEDADLVELYDDVNNGSQSASLLKPKDHLIKHPDVIFEGKFSAPMRRLDDFDDGVSNFINMDIQGYEIHALRGGEDVLKGVDYIMTEVNYREIYEDCTRFDDLVPYLDGHGFKLVEESAKSRTSGFGWGDALFIRK